MKKVVLLTLLTIFLSAFLFSCETGAEDKLYIVKQTYTDKSTDMTVEYFYNEDYKIIKQVSDTGKDSSTVSDYGYDENGYQNYQKAVSKAGLTQEIFLKNDSNGRVIERKIVSNYNGNITEAVVTIEYIDDNGSYIETSTSGVVTTHTLDEHGNSLTIQSTGVMEQTVTYENKYENDILKEAQMTTVTKSKTVTQTIKYEYDKYGNKIKSEVFDEHGNVTVTETFEYSKSPQIIK